MLAFVRGVRFLRPVRLLVCGRSATAGASVAAIRCVFTVGRVLCFHLSSCLRRARAHTHTRVCCQVSVSSGATDTVVSATSSFPVSLTSLFSRLVFMIMIIIVIIMIFFRIFVTLLILLLQLILQQHSNTPVVLKINVFCLYFFLL